MKTSRVLVTAYAINPYKGSEDGMGWNFTQQIAKNYNATVVTRKNNRPAIEKYLAEHPNANDSIEFVYADAPKAVLFWKKGPHLSMIYYYFWQLLVAFKMWPRHREFDVVHNLNFHNDWTPTFLWILGKPLVWGPVGHHPEIPSDCLEQYGTGNRILEGAKIFFKNMFKHLDPFLFISKRKADHIFCMNSEAQAEFELSKTSIMPSVASEVKSSHHKQNTGKKYNVLSVGRLVPLKGFDLTIRSFAKFIHGLPSTQKEICQLTIVGSGPEQPFLEKLIAGLDIGSYCTIIPWMDRSALMKHYDESDVFLFPSHEGAGMVVAEALASGCPVVCLDNCGPGEFIGTDGGIAVAYNHYQQAVDDLSATLSQLFVDEELRNNLSNKAVQRHRNHFSWNKRATQIDQVYSQVLTISSNHITRTDHEEATGIPSI